MTFEVTQSHKQTRDNSKNGKDRVIVPAQVAMDALRDEKERQVGNQQIYGECWHNPENYVFTDMLGKHLVRRTVVKHFRAVSDRAGIKNVRFHDLRHSFAVNSLMIGDDVKTVQTNLGHATASFTLDVYGHVTYQMQEASASRMQAYINEHEVHCPICGKFNWTPIRNFNLMFQTSRGVTEDSTNTIYLRPETAQGEFVNFLNVQRTTRAKVPFGIGQIGKAFRNEITPGNFIFRTIEFEQMEHQWFCKADSSMDFYHQYKYPLPYRPLQATDTD